MDPDERRDLPWLATAVAGCAVGAPELIGMIWRYLSREMASARGRDRLLAVIAGCLAWLVVEVLRLVFG